jgi:hypothetical protein
MILIKACFVFCVLGFFYLVGFDRVYWALDTADAALKAAYHHAAAQSAERHCTTRTQLPQRTTRKVSPDGC